MDSSEALPSVHWFLGQCPPPLLKAPSSVVEVEMKARRPPLNYAQLISRALKSKGGRATLPEIYSSIEQEHPYFRYAKSEAWKNSIRQLLSRSERFERVTERGKTMGGGKSSSGGNRRITYWALSDSTQGRKKRRPEGVMPYQTVSSDSTSSIESDLVGSEYDQAELHGLQIALHHHQYEGHPSTTDPASYWGNDAPFIHSPIALNRHPWQEFNSEEKFMNEYEGLMLY